MGFGLDFLWEEIPGVNDRLAMTILQLPLDLGSLALPASNEARHESSFVAPLNWNVCSNFVVCRALFYAGRARDRYRGTSLTRNCHSHRTTVGP